MDTAAIGAVIEQIPHTPELGLVIEDVARSETIAGMAVHYALFAPLSVAWKSMEDVGELSFDMPVKRKLLRQHAIRAVDPKL